MIKIKVGETIPVLLEKIEDKNGEVLVSASKAQKIKGWYELEVACDGEYAAVWTNNYPKVPLITQDDLTKKSGNVADPDFPDNLWGKDRKDIRGGGIGYRIIQLGELTGGSTLTVNFEIRNGNYSPTEESWNKNPGAIAWKLRY